MRHNLFAVGDLRGYRSSIYTLAAVGVCFAVASATDAVEVTHGEPYDSFHLVSVAL